MELFAKDLAGKSGLLEALPRLEGRLIACHCKLQEQCHVDKLIAAFEDLKADRVAAAFGDPPEDQEIRARAAAWRALRPLAGRALEAADRRVLTVRAGLGEPVFIGSCDRLRLLADGGGLCSPGQWRPSRRLEPVGVAAGLRGEMLKRAVSSGQGAA